MKMSLEVAPSKPKIETHAQSQRGGFLEKLQRRSKTVPAALSGLFLAACASSGIRETKIPAERAGTGDYGFVLGNSPADLNRVRADVQTRLKTRIHEQQKEVRNVTISGPQGQSELGDVTFSGFAKSSEAQGTAVGYEKFQGLEQAGVPAAEMRRLVESLPGHAFDKVKYATTCENRPNPSETGRMTLATVEVTTGRKPETSLVIYGPECHGNTSQARTMFMNFLGQQIGLAYAFAHLPEGNEAYLKIDELMEPHRGPEVQYSPGPVFDQPILNGFNPPGMSADQMRAQRRKLYFASLVNSALHTPITRGWDWRQAFMLRLVTTHRAPADKAQKAVEAVSEFFEARDKDSDPSLAIEAFQKSEADMKYAMCSIDVEIALSGAVKDPGIGALISRAWKVGPTERATYLDYAPRLPLNQRTPYAQELESKTEKAEKSLLSQAANKREIEATIQSALFFANKLSDLHRQFANQKTYSPMLGNRIAQYATRLDAAYSTLSPTDKEKAMPMIIQAVRIAYYGDPMKQ